MEKLFAVCTPGLEVFAAQELQQLGLMRRHEIGSSAEPGGIEFEGSYQDVYRANLSLRTVSRVLVRLVSFTLPNFPNSVGRRAVCFGKTISLRDDRSHYV